MFGSGEAAAGDRGRRGRSRRRARLRRTCRPIRAARRYGAAQALARRFPGYPLAYAAAINRLTAIVGGGSTAPTSRTGIRPWLGREAAFAVLDTPGGSAPSLIVLDVANRARALAVRDRCRRRAGRRLRRRPDPRLPLGHRARVRPPLPCWSAQDASVRAAIAAGTGRARSLAAESRVSARFGRRAGGPRARRLRLGGRSAALARAARGRDRCDRRDCSTGRRSRARRSRFRADSGGARRADPHRARPGAARERGRAGPPALVHADAPVGAARRARP